MNKGRFFKAVGLVTVIGIVSVWGWKWWNTPSSSESAVVERAALVTTTSPHCDGELRVVHLSYLLPQVINPDGRCVVKWRVDSGRVDLIDSSGKILPVGPEGGSFDAFWTESVRASTPGAIMHYKLVTS